MLHRRSCDLQIFNSQDGSPLCCPSVAFQSGPRLERNRTTPLEAAQSCKSADCVTLQVLPAACQKSAQGAAAFACTSPYASQASCHSWGSSHCRVHLSPFRNSTSPRVLGPVATASGMHGGEFERLGPVTTASGQQHLQQRQVVCIISGYDYYYVQE